MQTYTQEEKKIHESIYFLTAQSLMNPTLKVRIMQYATQEIINEINIMIDCLTFNLNDEGLRHDQFQLLDWCKETKSFLEKLVMNRGFTQYRSLKQ